MSFDEQKRSKNRKKINAAGQRAVASVNGVVVNHPNIEFSEEGL